MKGKRFLICITFCFTSVWAQPTQNLKKYWRYHERFKNYVVTGHCQGCSLPSKARELSFWFSPPNSNIIGSGHQNYEDETIHLGHYIGVLATEFALFDKHGIPANNDLWYALEAFNRLDQTAEGWWRQYHLNQSPVPQNGDLNGFFIRDDVPADFVNQMYTDNGNSNLIENALNSSYFPSDDGRIAEVIGSSFTDAVYTTGAGFNSTCSNFNGAGVGPREESLDQVCQLMVGLALAAKYVPPGMKANDINGIPKQFADGETDILLEVKAIATRITGWIQSHEWIIENPVTGSCVKATFWPKPAEFLDQCKCIAGGSKFRAFAYGLAKVNARIQCTSFANDADAASTFATLYGEDPEVVNSASIWLTGLQWASIGKEDYKVLSLAAAGHVWGAGTGLVLQKRCAKEFVSGQHPGDRLHLPLLHQALYGSSNDSYPATFYECLLDHAECYGPHGDDGNEIWSQNQGLLVYGYFHTPSLNEYNGLSYMFYFNIYNLVYPTYLPGSNYHYIQPFDLCENDIVKTGFIKDGTPFIESDQKTFIASNSITAQGGGNPNNPTPYIIDNDDDPQPMPYAQANVTFMAKNLVHLLPGFEAHEGAEFHATINTALQGMNCTTPNQASVSDCSGLINEWKNLTTNDTISPETLETKTFEQQNSNAASIKKSEFSFYDYAIIPNPNNGNFTITIINKSDRKANISKVIIYDAIWNIVKEIEMANEPLQIDISEYPKGLYFVKIENEQGTKMEKIIYQ